MGENVCNFIKMLRKKFKTFSITFAENLIVVEFPPLTFPVSDLSDMTYNIGKKYGLKFLSGKIKEWGGLEYVECIIVAPEEEAEKWKKYR